MNNIHTSFLRDKSIFANIHNPLHRHGRRDIADLNSTDVSYRLISLALSSRDKIPVPCNTDNHLMYAKIEL